MSTRRATAAWHLVLAPLAVIMIFPFVQMVLSSLMAKSEVASYPPTLIPHHPTLGAYGTIFLHSRFPHWFLNTVLISTVAVVSQLVLCPLAGYAFARMRFLGSGILQLLLLLTVFIPPQLLMIPVYRLYTRLGIVDTLPSLMLPWMASAIGIFLMRQFFVRLPREIEEAALVDGCTQLGVLVRVVAPLMRPALTTVGLLALLGAWNDFLWPLVSIGSESRYTLQLGLTTYQGVHHTEWSTLMAANVLVTGPLLVAFLVGQRHFVESMTFSAVKG